MKGIRGWGLGFSLIKIALILFIFLYTLPFTLYPVSAQQYDIGYSRISPASSFYSLKVVREYIELKLALTSRVKMLREMEFAIRRLREVSTLVKINQDLIQPTLESYYASLKTLPESNLDNTEIAAMIRNNLVIHLQVLRHIYDLVSNLKAKMAIRTAMNRIIQRQDVPSFAKMPVCNFFIKEASSSALNQTEQVVLLERANKCFNDLGSNRF